MGYAPTIAAAAGLSLASAGVQPVGWWRACGLAGAAGILLQLTVMYRFYKLAGAKGELAWSYLAGYVVTTIALAVSIMKLRPGARVVWRNTSYSARV